jgi:hypothetical protein
MYSLFCDHEKYGVDIKYCVILPMYIGANNGYFEIDFCRYATP